MAWKTLVRPEKQAKSDKPDTFKAVCTAGGFEFGVVRVEGDPRITMRSEGGFWVSEVTVDKVNALRALTEKALDKLAAALDAKDCPTREKKERTKKTKGI